jgi:arginine N-succinyltransferase
VIRYEIRGAVPGDEEALLALARELNTVNLPNDRPHIQRLLADNQRSFTGEIAPKLRKFVFLLWDRDTGRAAGTSMVIAQLGRRGAPYIYFDVNEEEKYAGSVDKHFHHELLRIGFSYDGPTEIGGLIVAPDYRKAPERLGLLISYVRFLFIAAHRKLFRDELLAELLPPLEPDGTSHLWEAVGRRFTDMSYPEADLLSSENKDFIRDLFPRDPIYVTLLSQGARAVIGQVGAQTKGVEKMLRRVGFKYVSRVDPFDGGPHFTAPTDEVTLVKATRTCLLGAPLEETPSLRTARAIVARDVDAPPYFHALDTRAYIEGETVTDDTVTGPATLRVPAESADLLGLKMGDKVHCLPLP